MFNRFILMFCFIAFGVSLNAQVTDKDKRNIRIPAVESKKEKDSTPQKIKVAPKKNLKADADKSNKDKNATISRTKVRELERPFSMTGGDGLKSPSLIFEERWRKEAQATGIRRFMSDQFLGQYDIDTEFVNIVCRDHEYPDGDRVSVSLNGEVVYNNVLLTSQYRRLKINLTQGINKIDITALNQGDSGPNTAEFVVYDDKGTVVSSKEWNLLTGVKAMITFINEKPKITAKNEGN
ncbi:hypothetical protein BTO05_02420 [Winogradskyella sp. PC-19]|uniref:hypothetical protein n=1 Tax=unclassified Winogradskyella TaxID=2615021 RepID=UPI000B3C8FE7|nr:MULTISPECIES: hypothetical protein [unclassified Winogradskyella]ARV08547.1 hypothetical protein BTO05_02420 [Winogradskyella sp. PC-19]